MQLKLHPSWVVIFLAILIMVTDIFLVLFGVIKEDKSDVVVIFEGASEWFGARVEDAIDAEAAGLGMGYLLGTKEKLSSDLKSKIQVVGLSHVIVVSGTHLAIIVTWARKIFGKLSRTAGVYFSILLVACYIGVVGLTPSLLRAGIVAILTLLAWRTGRKFEAWRILLLVATITLLYNPAYLLNVSWQLSMAAYAGILLLLPILEEFFYAPGEHPKLIGSTLLASLAATITCLPISLYYFGSVSLLSFVANLLILPTVSIAMGLTFAAGLFGRWFGFLANVVLNYHINIVNFLGQYEELLIKTDKNNPTVFVWYVLVMIVIVCRAWKRHKRRRARLQNAEKLGWKNPPDLGD